MSRTILSGGSIVDVVAGSVRTGSVSIEDGKVAAVGDVQQAKGDEIVDVSGRYVMPALFNCHAHLGWDGVHSLKAQADWPEQIQAFTVAMNIARTLHAGVTTIRDLGMRWTNVFAKQAVEEGRVPWLRLFINGHAISTTGGHTWFVCRQADGVDDCRKAIREQVVNGATWIKIMACHDHDQFTQAEIDAMVDEAHQAGIKVTAHATMDSAIKRVVQAGVDCVEHGGPMSDEAIQMMLDRRVWLVTTLGPMFLQAEKGLDHGLTQDVVDRRMRQINEPDRWTAIQRAVEAGVPHAFGTDAGSPIVPHDEIVGELQALMKLEIVKDNAQALRTITINAAQLLGVDAELGTVEAGKSGDVIVLDGNPLEDLEHLRRISRVYVRGALAVKDGAHLWPAPGEQVPLKLPGVFA